MHFSDVRKYGFDTETTGVDTEESRIVTAALVAHGSGRPDIAKTWLINPGIEIPEQATEIHGITTEYVRANGVEPKPALDEIAGLLTRALWSKSPIVAFNLAFDWSILDAELRRYELPTIGQRFARPVRALIDPYVIDKAVDKWRPGTRKLQPTAELYGVELNNWHSAEADSLAAVLIAEKLFARYDFLNRMSPERLYVAQQNWRKEQCAGLQAYFRTLEKCGEEKYNPEAVINGAWPLLHSTERVAV